MLLRHGIKVRLIERAKGPTTFSKAVGIHARTLESMHALGITEKMISDGHPMQSFRVNEGGSPIMSAGFNGIGSPYEFVLGLPQSSTERNLLSRLQTLGGNVEWQTRLVSVKSVGGQPGSVGDLAEVVIEHADGSMEGVRCQWLIGADGSRSSVRELAGIDFPGGDYGNAFILGDAQIEWAGAKDQLQFFLSGNGYLLLVPMPGGLHRIIAQTGRTYEDFQKSNKPTATLEDLQSIVDRNGPGGIRVHSPQWLTCAPFYHRCASTAVKHRVVLAGDAFHLFSPLGAQGLNTGFLDVFNLAWKIAFVERGWAEPTLLQTYDTERQTIANLIGKVTAKTTRYITATHPLRRLIRRNLTRRMNATAKVQQQLPRLLAGLLQSYGPSAELSGPSASNMPASGGRIPHAWVPDGIGYRPLASLIHGVNFTLLLLRPTLNNESVAALHDFYSEEIASEFPFLQCLVVGREIEDWRERLPKTVRLIEDSLGDVVRQLSAGHGGLVLVRPDGYCALSCEGWPFEEVKQYFRDRKLGNTTTPAISQPALEGASHVI
jgi:2-polyprenyl-6-methoxyphenol hydroxylase-like FAD-dependent oxidoreductase